MCQLPLLALLAADRFGGFFFVYDQRAMTLIINFWSKQWDRHFGDPDRSDLNGPTPCVVKLETLSMQDIMDFKVVTPAEKKVLRQIVKGKTSSEIAYALGRSVHTIEDHRARYMSKLGADNLLELIERAKSLRSIRRNDFQQEDSSWQNPAVSTVGIVEVVRSFKWREKPHTTFSSPFF